MGATSPRWAAAAMVAGEGASESYEGRASTVVIQCSPQRGNVEDAGAHRPRAAALVRPLEARPSVAARPQPIQDAGVGVHAAADGRRDGRAVLRALHRALSGCG